MSRTERFNRSAEIAKARRSDDPEASALAEMQLAHEILNPTYFEAEADLITTAYLNYRYMTPYARTEAFMRMYTKWYENKQDSDYGLKGRRATKEFLSGWSNRDFAYFWRARQHADAIGMPYDRYIIATMSRAVDTGYGRLPWINQIYTPEMVAHAQAQLQVLYDAKSIRLLPGDCDPRFFVENFVGDPIQMGALDVIEADVRQSGKATSIRKLSAWMRERRVITEAEARRRLGDELVDAALTERMLNEPRAETKPLQQQGSVPGCFGYHRAAHLVCQACPVAAACIERAGKLNALLQAKHGTTELRAQKIKVDNRDRKRRERERARAGMTMTLQEEKRRLRELGSPKATQKRLDAKKRRDDKKARGPKAPKAGKNDNMRPERGGDIKG